MAESKPKLEEMKFRAPYRSQEKVAYTKRPDTKSMQMQLDQAGKVEDPAPMIHCYCWAYTEAWYCWEEGLLLVRTSVDAHGDFADRRFIEAAPAEASIYQTSWNIAVEDMPVKAREWANKVRAMLKDRMADAFIVDWPADAMATVPAPIVEQDGDSASYAPDDLAESDGEDTTFREADGMPADLAKNPYGKTNADVDADQLATVKAGLASGKYRKGKVA